MDSDNQNRIAPEIYRTIIASSVDGFTLINAGGYILDVNDSFCQMMGYTRNELINSHMSALDAIDSADDVAERSEKIIRRGSLRFETKHIHKNGSVIDVEVSASYTASHGGSFFSFVRDITQQKRIEHALRKSEEKFSKAFKASPAAMAIVSLENGRYIEVNDNFLQVSGFQKDEVIGHTPIELHVWVDENERQQYLDDLSRNGSFKRNDVKFRMKNSEVRTFEVSSEIIEIESEKCSLNFIGDITERKQAEEALQESNNKFHSLVANIPGYIAYVNATTLQYELVNDAFEKAFGIPREKIVGSHIKDVIGEANYNFALKYIEEAISGKPSGYENTFDMTSGKRWIKVNYNPVFGSDGRVTSIVVLCYDITELRQTEDSLRENRALLNSVINGTSDAVYVKDLQGRYLLFNSAAERFVGKSAAEVLGRDDTTLFPPAEAMTVMEGDRKVIEGGEVRSYEEVVTDATGRVVTFLSMKGPLFDANGTPVGLFGIARDITERRQSEKSLLSSEERHRAILQTTMDGFWLTDAQGHLREVNEAYCCMSGYSAEELLALSIPDLEAIETADETSDRIKLIMEKGETRFESQHRRKDGSLYDVECSVKYRHEDGGQLVVFLRDITDRKKVENALKASEYLFKESQRAAHIGSYNADFIHNHWDSSEVLDIIFGIDRDYVHSIPGWLDIVHPDDRNMMNRYLKDEVIARRHPFEKEYRIVRKNDGETRWVYGLGEARYDDNGNITSLAGTIQDITERKKIEDDRTNLEQQLLHSQKLESLGVLAGGIAHDFNNILAIIIGHCSLAELDYDKAGDHIPVIEQAANRAAELCRQMLAYAGKANIVKSQVDMSALLAEMVKMLKTTLSQNAVIKLDRSTDIPFVSGDASQLRQVVMNLILNAAEAIGEAEGEIHISLSKTVINAGQSIKDHLGKVIPPGWYDCLEVTDDGCGMDYETRQRIFEPFYTTKFTGRGLGMSAVLGIIMSHGGSLQLFSQSGQGTTFKIFLPVLISDAAGNASLQQTAVPESWKGTGTVLLVEDEEMIRTVAKILIEELGFTVIEAVNGKEALKLYQLNAADIDLVVTDMGMPVMNGYDMFHELKKLNPKLPIIVSSGFGDTDVASRISREDIAAIISKPYNFNQLRDTLKRVVEDTKR
jgi:PAS domain S-box-containing protein